MATIERLIRQIESDLNAARQRPAVRAQHTPEMHAVKLDDLDTSQRTASTAQFEQRAATAVAAAMVPIDTDNSTARLPMIVGNEVEAAPLVGSATAVEAQPVEALLERSPVKSLAESPAVSQAAMPATLPDGEASQRATSVRSSYLDEVLAAPVARVTPDIDLRSAEADRANLDDDAFFATLRDAVADDAPLGPSDHSEELVDEPDPSFREMFRRRR